VAIMTVTAYFAAPLFNDMERNFNLVVTRKLEAYVEVFLPQRDGGLLMDLVKNGTSPDEAAKTVFDMDRRAMESADILIAVLDGAKIDEGVAFEIGYMFGLGKYCIGYQSDMRRALPIGNNPMITGSLATICANTDALLSTVAEYCQAIPGDGRNSGITERRLRA